MELHKEKNRRGGILVCIVILVLAVAFFFWIRPRLQVYNSAVKVPAVVSRCDRERIPRVNKTSESHYHIYVDYSFEGEKYRDVYWKTRKSSLVKGSEVAVRIHPEYPDKPIPQSPYTSVAIVLFCLLWGLYYGIRMIFKPLTNTQAPRLRRF